MSYDSKKGYNLFPAKVIRNMSTEDLIEYRKKHQIYNLCLIALKIIT